MKHSRVIGIDPGVTGAIALLQNGNYQGVWDMPVITDSNGKKTPSGHALAELLRDHKPDLVVIEKVNAMPSAPGKDGKRRTMGAQSMFNFGRGFGVIDASTQILKLPTVYVTPAVWKRKCGLINAKKAIHRELATDLFPQAASELRLKKHHGRADALLIARHGHRFW